MGCLLLFRQLQVHIGGCTVFEDPAEHVVFRLEAEHRLKPKNGCRVRLPHRQRIDDARSFCQASCSAAFAAADAFNQRGRKKMKET